MSKYSLLGQYLSAQAVTEIPMTFADIESVIGAKLPSSAYKHRPWWSNNPSNSVMTKVWLDAGFRVEQVDMKKKRLVFKRPSPSPGVSEQSRPYEKDAPKSGRHPMIGALKGTFSIAPGTDLTQPAMPEWADLIDELYGPEVKPGAARDK